MAGAGAMTPNLRAEVSGSPGFFDLLSGCSTRFHGFHLSGLSHRGGQDYGIGKVLEWFDMGGGSPWAYWGPTMWRAATYVIHVVYGTSIGVESGAR